MVMLQSSGSLQEGLYMVINPICDIGNLYDVGPRVFIFHMTGMIITSIIIINH